MFSPVSKSKHMCNDIWLSLHGFHPSNVGLWFSLRHNMHMLPENKETAETLYIMGTSGFYRNGSVSKISLSSHPSCIRVPLKRGNEICTYFSMFLIYSTINLTMKKNIVSASCCLRNEIQNVISLPREENITRQSTGNENVLACKCLFYPIRVASIC